MTVRNLLRGWELQQAGDLEAAEAAYRAGLAAGEPEATYYLGELLVMAGRPAEAVPLLRSAVADGDLDAHVPLGNALKALGALEEAEVHYRLASENDDLAGRHNLGLLLKERGRPEEALVVWQRSFAAGETDQAEMAHLYADLGRLADAEQWFRRAAADGDVEALTDLGAMFYDKREYEQALEVLERAAQLGSSSGRELAEEVREVMSGKRGSPSDAP